MGQKRGRRDDKDPARKSFLEEAFEHRQQRIDAAAGRTDQLDELPLAAVAPEPEPEPEPAPEPEPEPEPEPAPIVELGPMDRALIDEAAKKSGLLWVTTPVSPGGRAVWHTWVDGVGYVITGPGEQPDPGLDGVLETTIVARSKETTARLILFGARVTRLQPDDESWATVTAELAKSRLNPVSSDGTASWAAPEYAVYRLEPNGLIGERPGDYVADSHRARPVATAATTSAPKPRILHKRHGSGRPLS